MFGGDRPSLLFSPYQIRLGTIGNVHGCHTCGLYKEFLVDVCSCKILLLRFSIKFNDLKSCQKRPKYVLCKLLRLQRKFVCIWNYAMKTFTFMHLLRNLERWWIVNLFFTERTLLYLTLYHIRTRRERSSIFIIIVINILCYLIFPLLFNIYSGKKCQQTLEIYYGKFSNEFLINYLSYACDTVLFADTAEDLQS